MTSSSSPAQPPSSAPPSSEELLICFCHGVPESEIRKAIAEGACTLEDIQNRTGASTGCGGCMPEVRKLLAALASKK